MNHDRDKDHERLIALVEKQTKEIIEIKAQHAIELYQLSYVIDQLPGSLYWKNRDGVYLGHNSFAMNKMLSIKFTPEKIIGKTDYDLFTSEVAEEFRKNDIGIMQDGKEQSIEETTISPTGEKVIQLSVKRPLRDMNGNIVGVIGNTTDITLLKNAIEKAEQSTRSMTEFIRNMEHDIRTPFSGVYGMAEFMESEEKDPQKKELLHDMAVCAKELLDYCNDIVYCAKLEEESVPLMAKKFDVEELIESVIRIEKPVATQKSIQLLHEISADIPKIYIGDRRRLQRILINLTSNAIKFTQHGHVKISVSGKNIDKRHSVLKISVSDTGIGIPEDKQQYIYEKFTRLTPSNKGLYRGTGLGLHVVKELIHEMDGEIDLLSAPDKGSEFICTIPFTLPLLEDEIVLKEEAIC